MAKQFSFDIESDYDIAEVDHAVDQARREIANRYDFKNTAAKLEYADSQKSGLSVTGENDYQLNAIIDIVRGKLAKRGVSQKVLDISHKPEQRGIHFVKPVPFQKGLDQDKAKSVTKLIREPYPKVKTQIQGQTVRVISQSKDELQAVMQFIKSKDFDFPLIFTNYR